MSDAESGREAVAAGPAGARAHRAWMLAGPALLVLGAAGWYLASGRYITTDNAYLRADFVAVSPRIDGTISETGGDGDATVENVNVIQGVQVALTSFEFGISRG